MFHQQIVHGFLVTVGPSIYTNRAGHTDIRVQHESEWGAKHENGRRYSTIQVMAAENLETIRNYGSIQRHVIDAAIEFARAVLAPAQLQEVL